MSDIVETLRKGEAKSVDGWWFVMAEAANEIERLRAENEKLHREAAIRIDQIEREQEAHLRTIADYNRVAVENAKLRAGA
jgi:dephospho-CoA kinase